MLCWRRRDIRDSGTARCFASDPVIDQPSHKMNRAPSDNAGIKSIEEREADTFLDEVYKSDEISQRNREKKLLRESATQDLSGQKISIREAENNIVRDVFDFTAT